MRAVVLFFFFFCWCKYASFKVFLFPCSLYKFSCCHHSELLSYISEEYRGCYSEIIVLTSFGTGLSVLFN